MVSYYCIYFLVLGGIIPTGIADGRWRRLFLKIYIPLLLIILLLVATLRSPGIDNDYFNYLAWFDKIAAGGLTALDWTKDPGFVFILNAAAALNVGYVGATSVLVVLALAGTTWFAWLACKERFLLLYIYLAFCKFFVGQEMTAIRIGIAIPLLSLSILYMYRGRKSLALILFFIGAAFHLSVLIALPVVLLAMLRISFKTRWWIGGMIASVILLRVAARNILESISQLDRITPYMNGVVEINSIKTVSVYYLLARIAFMLLVVCFLWKKVSPEERLFVFCAGIGLSIEYLFSFNDVMALRGSGLYGMFSIMLYIVPVKYIKTMPMRASYVLFLLVLGAVFYAQSLAVMRPYQWILG